GVFFGIGEPVAQYMPPGYWAFDPQVTPEKPEYGHDPAAARRLLAEAGHPGGVDFEMLRPSLDDHRAVAEATVPMRAQRRPREHPGGRGAHDVGDVLRQAGGQLLPRHGGAVPGPDDRLPGEPARPVRQPVEHHDARVRTGLAGRALRGHARGPAPRHPPDGRGGEEDLEELPPPRAPPAQRVDRQGRV